MCIVYVYAHGDIFAGKTMDKKLLWKRDKIAKSVGEHEKVTEKLTKPLPAPVSPLTMSNAFFCHSFSNCSLSFTCIECCVHSYKLKFAYLTAKYKYKSSQFRRWQRFMPIDWFKGILISFTTKCTFLLDVSVRFSSKLHLFHCESSNKIPDFITS